MADAEKASLELVATAKACDSFAKSLVVYGSGEPHSTDIANSDLGIDLPLPLQRCPMSSLVTVKQRTPKTAIKNAPNDCFEKGIARIQAIRRIDGVAEYLASIGHASTDWTIELSRSYVYNSRLDLGFDIGRPPPRYVNDDGAMVAGGFCVTLVDHCRWGATPNAPELKRLKAIAAHIYSLRLAAASLHALGLRL